MLAVDEKSLAVDEKSLAVDEKSLAVDEKSLAVDMKLLGFHKKLSAVFNISEKMSLVFSSSDFYVDFFLHIKIVGHPLLKKLKGGHPD